MIHPRMARGPAPFRTAPLTCGSHRYAPPPGQVHLGGRVASDRASTWTSPSLAGESAPAQLHGAAGKHARCEACPHEGIRAQAGPVSFLRLFLLTTKCTPGTWKQGHTQARARKHMRTNAHQKHTHMRTSTQMRTQFCNCYRACTCKHNLEAATHINCRALCL